MKDLTKRKFRDNSYMILGEIYTDVTFTKNSSLSPDLAQKNIYRLGNIVQGYLRWDGSQSSQTVTLGTISKAPITPIIVAVRGGDSGVIGSCTIGTDGTITIHHNSTSSGNIAHQISFIYLTTDV